MTEIAAHRGGAALWPENSRRAFEGAASLAVEQIEFDVQLSADGVPVIFHDTTLDRVTDGSGPLADKSLAELKALSINDGGGPIMTLEEGLEVLAQTHLVLRCEIKPGPGLKPYPGLRDLVLKTIAAHGLMERTVITSFHLGTVTGLGPSMGLKDTIWLIADPLLGLTSPADVAALAHRSDIAHIALHHLRLRDGTLNDLRDFSLNVSAFGILENDAIDWALSEQLPVFTTDRPDAALRIREGRAGMT